MMSDIKNPNIIIRFNLFNITVKIACKDSCFLCNFLNSLIKIRYGIKNKEVVMVVSLIALRYENEENQLSIDSWQNKKTVIQQFYLFKKMFA